ncbi:GrpB family protein [Uliginosibacterium sp. H1]|uniref:GrpB family protein n=1 Tax=Uliginosibacterium sp. H1 TaxID=3114757 RepID=UPI002E17953E|nr:GrpB family protein [Uliginosibacterium sp. H1]
MPLTSVIEHYDPAWPLRYEEAVAYLRPTVGSSLLAIHHVGSTAVPQLAAKPEIDILIVVTPASADHDWSGRLSTHGYRRGGDLSTGHQFYKRDAGGVRTHKLHVCVEGHPEIARMLRFRDLLRDDDLLRAEYAALKLMLERTKSDGIDEYPRKKAPFIDDALATDSSAN